MLLAYHLSPDERVRFGLAVKAAQMQLRQMVGELDPSVSAQIMITSENALCLHLWWTDCRLLDLQTDN